MDHTDGGTLGTSSITLPRESRSMLSRGAEPYTLNPYTPGQGSAGGRRLHNHRRGCGAGGRRGGRVRHPPAHRSEAPRRTSAVTELDINGPIPRAVRAGWRCVFRVSNQQSRITVG